SEQWSDDPLTVTVGEPLTRTIVIEADGVLETQLPELAPPTGVGLRQYADQPEVSREIMEGGRFRARRIERLAVIAQESGALELPAVELPWWNVEQGRWELARLEPRSIEAAPSTETRTMPEAVTAEPAVPPGLGP